MEWISLSLYLIYAVNQLLPASIKLLSVNKNVIRYNTSNLINKQDNKMSTYYYKAKGYATGSIKVTLLHNSDGFTTHIEGTRNFNKNN